jgi:hypothetical protein
VNSALTTVKNAMEANNALSAHLSLTVLPIKQMVLLSVTLFAPVVSIPIILTAHVIHVVLQIVLYVHQELLVGHANLDIS